MTTHTDLMRRLDAHLVRAAKRVRMRRLVVALWADGVALGGVGALIASLDLLGPSVPLLDGLLSALIAMPELLLLAAVASAVAAWCAPVPSDQVAREIDQRLELADRTVSALAVANGTVTSLLGPRVLEQASESIDASWGRLETAFPMRPADRLAGILRVASIIVALWAATVLLAQFLGSGGGGQTVDQLPGAVPTADDEGEPAENEGEALPPEGDEDEGEPEPPPPPDVDDPEPEAQPEPEPPTPPAGPLATAELVLSDTEFDEGDSILSLAVGKPGAGLADARGFTVSVEVDGTMLGTGQSMALSPSGADGEIVPVRMGRLPGAAEVLKPGQHEAVLVLEPEGGGEAIRSEPKPFRIRGGDDKGGGGGQPPPPPPPTPQPEEQPEPPPPEEQPDDGGGEEEGEPEEADAPDVPEETEKKVVVPLFDDGPEVEKVGPRLVLVPGGGPDQPPKKVPLEEAFEEARKRAEQAVDRAGVRASDRELVRRYFERLKRLMDERQPADGDE